MKHFIPTLQSTNLFIQETKQLLETELQLEQHAYKIIEMKRLNLDGN